MNILYIDTSNNKEIVVRLNTHEGEFIEKSTAVEQKAQATLPLIDKLIQKAGITLNQINKINVKTGPGSFTGLRVGISIANTLSFALGVPVNNKNNHIEEATY